MKSELCVIVYICSLYIFFTDAQSVLIEGSNPRELIGGTNARIICKVTSGIADGENPNLEWFNQAGNKVPNTGRVYVYANDAKESSLMITKVEEDDGGSYNCSGVINGQKEYARIVVTTKMPVVVTENQAPRNQKFSNGTSAQVKCAPQGDVQVSWLDKDGQPIFSTHDRFVINPGHLLIPDILTTDDGTYTCRVVGSDDFLNIQINVIVTVPPKITRPPTGQSISVGEAARFECIATAKPKPTYQWFKDDQSIELAGSRYEIDADNGILIIKKVIKDDHGNYRCKAFSEGRFDEKTAELRVLVPPQIVKLDDATGDEGSGGTIKCIASGDPIPEIKWQKQGNSQDFTDGTQIGETRISVTHQQRSDRMEVEGTLDISNLVSSDAGVYICKATNEAKSVEQTATLIVQYKPNFSKVKKDVLFSWSGKETVITCIASSVPQSNVSWEKDNQPITAGNGYSMSSVIIGDDTTGTLSFLVDFSNAASRYGIYTCKASNRIGESKKNFTLRKADPPQSPPTSIKDPTPTSLILVVTIPEAMPQVTMISVNYANIPNPIERPISKGQKKVEVYVAGLSARTQYTFLVTAQSEVGSSPDLSLPYTTLAPRRPYPITVISRPIGDYPLRYNLQWNTPSNGGYAISNIYIKYAEVEVFPNKSQSNEFQKKDEISGWYEVKPALAGDVTTYEITGLKPSTYYEVKVTATNIEGSSDEKPMIFLTSLEDALSMQGSDEPMTTAAPVEGDKDPSKNSQDTNNSTDDSLPLGPLIAIIIIVVIIVFIVIDVTCYFKRKCGVFMCIKERVGRTGSMETRSKEKIIEEGDADGSTRDKNRKQPEKLNDKKQNGTQLQEIKNEKKDKNEINNEKRNEDIPKEGKESNEIKQNGNNPMVISELPSDAKKQNGADQIPTKNKTDNQKQEEVKKVVNEPAFEEKTIDQNQEKPNTTPKQPENEQTQVPQKWKTEETLDTKNVIFDQRESMEDKKEKEQDKTEDKEQEKKVPLLADNKDTEGIDADQEVGETAPPSNEKEPEEKEEKPVTPVPEKDVEEAEEVKTEDPVKPASPKEEVKEVTEEKKEGE